MQRGEFAVCDPHIDEQLCTCEATSGDSVTPKLRFATNPTGNGLLWWRRWDWHLKHKSGLL